MQKAKLLVLSAVLLLLYVSMHTAQAQVLRIVSINTFTGALTGTALGGATIALQNDFDDYPLRFGVGFGTILGLGTGFYDLSRAAGYYGYRVDGLISSANTTGTIILLDTFYGTVTGALVGLAISLMSKESDILKGLQYGSGAGAWAGFAFGLVDAFALSSTGSYDRFYDEYAGRKQYPPGLLQFRSNNDHLAIGFLNPVLTRSYQIVNQGKPTSKTHLGIEFTRIQVAF